MCDNNDKKVIDSNRIISEKLVKIRESMEKNNSNIHGDGSGFTLGLNAERVEVLISDDEDVELQDEYLEEDMEDFNAKASSIIEEAKIRAEQIVAEARSEASKLMDEGRKNVASLMQQAKEEGMEQAKIYAKQQNEELANKLQKEFEEKCKKLDKEYDDRIKKMEPELVDILLKIFSEVIGVLSADKRDMILTLVNTVMSGTDVSKNYIIKCSREDAQFLRDNKERIKGTVGRNITVEIVEDPTLRRNQCLIDTDLGIFDCSLDIQMEKLIDAIKIIACSSVDYFN